MNINNLLNIIIENRKLIANIIQLIQKILYINKFENTRIMLLVNMLKRQINYDKINYSKNKYGGGKNTNKNGLSFEKNTNLSDNYILIYDNLRTNCKFKKIQFLNQKYQFILANKTQLHKYMMNNKEVNLKIIRAHGCKQPDEAFINLDKKIIYIIEKKYQNKGGSVCEKIQTGMFKKYHYNKIYPNYNVIYIYCLSNWYKYNCSVEIKHLRENNIPVFWGEDPNYKKNIIKFITDNSRHFEYNS